MPDPKILAFAGSTRTDSFNKKLIRCAADAARAAGAQVTLIDLRDFPLPLYDGDLEATAGLPANGRKLKDLFLAHNGLMISSPEYNSSVSAVLKNAIDWVSRPAPNEKPLECFTGKPALLMAASAGALGGLRGLVTLRSILGNIGVLVLPEQRAVVVTPETFAPDGSLTDPKLRENIANITKRLTQVAAKLSA